MKHIVIIGVGLIGGSLAKDIKRLNPKTTIYGLDKNENHLRQAKQLEFIDASASNKDIYQADLIVVAVPVDATVKLLPKLMDNISDKTLIMDVGSTKEEVCKTVQKHPKRRNFLATHPIAGTEFSGPNAAVEGLFQGKTNIICEVEQTAFKLQEKALKLFSDLGMRIRYMNPIAHDKHIAYVSHLSHISSFMLGKTVIEKEKNERDIFDMAGSGFASTVRLAKSSPQMWTPIFKHNKINVIEALDEYIQNLKNFKQYMINNDFDMLYKEMKSTNYIKEILEGIE